MFQYPLFRIELLSHRSVRELLTGQPVSISALSDRIAQRPRLRASWRTRPSFNIRSFGSNCSAACRRAHHSAPPTFQYPLFRIELLSDGWFYPSVALSDVSISALSDRIAQRAGWGVSRRRWGRFNIRSFGSNCSALRLPIAHLVIISFQYPLFRIELLSQRPGAPSRRDGEFQYPLFRIELLSRVPSLETHFGLMFQYPLFRIELLSVGV